VEEKGRRRGVLSFITFQFSPLQTPLSDERHCYSPDVRIYSSFEK
jgi:hypothetical protein